jgi:putative endonuclease
MLERQQAERHGRRAENIAAWWLRLRGFRLLAARLRTARGEIDLVMRRGTTLIFVEVKARSNMAEAEAALTARGLARMRAASAVVIARFDKNGRFNHRFDAVLIAPWQFPRHIQMVTTD